MNSNNLTSFDIFLFWIIGFVCQHCVVRWYHHVPRNCRQDAKGNYRTRSINHENQDHRSSREKILRLDRWINFGFTLHIPANVDLQARIRRVWPIHCPQKMLLKRLHVKKSRKKHTLHYYDYFLHCHLKKQSKYMYLQFYSRSPT